jgi:hypothetical protein
MTTATTVTFDGVSLANVQPREGEDGAGTQRRLISGYYNVQTSAVRPYMETFVCHTEDWTDVSAIRAKIGTTGRLIITDANDAIDLNNVIIVGSVAWSAWGMGWEYRVTFAQTV